VPLSLRVGHLSRISSYIDWATLGMWTERRAQMMMGMAEASLRHPGPGGKVGPDEEFLARLRQLVAEAREYLADDQFEASMARMRVAQDEISLRIITITEG
jgi:hypothetical protein